MNEFVDRSMGFDLVKKSERPCDYSTIDHTETKTEPEFCLYSLYDENTKTFIRKKIAGLDLLLDRLRFLVALKKRVYFPLSSLNFAMTFSSVAATSAGQPCSLYFARKSNI